MPLRDEHGDDDPVRLDDDEHAWWARHEVSQPWTPPREGGRPEPDPLDEYLGTSWRLEFGFEGPDGAAAVVGETADPDDPYELLAVEPAASWEVIVAAHRREARRHHPDRHVGASDAVRTEAEDRIRRINAAYRELKVRRGR